MPAWAMMSSMTATQMRGMLLAAGELPAFSIWESWAFKDWISFACSWLSWYSSWIAAWATIHTPEWLQHALWEGCSQRIAGGIIET